MQPQAESDDKLPRRLISVVIPVFNDSAKLALSLDSLASQPSHLWDVIVRDGSPDSMPSRQVVEQFQAKNPTVSVKFLDGSDSGVYDAMNQATERAHGKYLYYLGAGDTLCDGVFDSLASALEESYRDGISSLVYGDWIRPEPTGRLGKVYTKRDFRKGRNVSHQAIFYSRAVFKEFGFYDLRYKIRADNILNMRLWADDAVKKRYVPIAIAHFEGGGLSDTQKDTAFEDDFSILVGQLFGPMAAVLTRLAKIKRAIVGQKDTV